MPLLEPSAAAHAASLRYVHDDEPGFRRIGSARAFRYVDAKNRVVRERHVLSRIAALAIPPAWTHVWICASPNGHIQATGRDAKGRKQYRYHGRFRSAREETKYEHILGFGQALPKLRQQIATDLASPALGRDKVVATILRLMERTCIRVGNDCYAKDNHSFGLTTLRDRHAHFHGAAVAFDFTGKSGKVHHIAVRDAKLAAIVRRCRDIPGQRLFQWIDEKGDRHPVTSGDVNDYIRTACGESFTAKNVRTWVASVMAAGILVGSEPCANGKQTKRAIGACLEEVSAHLGNTKAIARKSYIHPALIDGFTTGTLQTEMQRVLSRARATQWMSREEAALLRFFDQRPSMAIAA
jgi:DNA topoisomerase-1